MSSSFRYCRLQSVEEIRKWPAMRGAAASSEEKYFALQHRTEGS
jgi:hypothetical protein